MRRYSLIATLFLLSSTAPAGAGIGFYCDAGGAVVMNIGKPDAPQYQFLAAKAYSGLCRIVDRARAAFWYTRAGEQGHKDAQFELGEMYFAGLGIPLDYPEAKKWYLKAAEQGHGGAQLRLGFLYAEKHFEGLTADPGEAEKWFLKAAEQDVKDARFRLGNFYLNYKNPPDTANAKLWLLKAAEGGHVTAMYDAGRLLMQLKETKEGLGWITKAAEKDDLQAKISLAEIYDKGRDVPYNPDEYFKWVMRIADHGAAPAYYLNKAGDMMLDGFGGRPANYPAARRFYERAAKKEDAHALRQLAYIYREGLGVKKDKFKTERYQKRADDAALKR